MNGKPLDYNDIRHLLEEAIKAWRPDLNTAASEPPPLNIASFVPQTIVLPALFIEPSPSKTSDDIVAMSSRSARWYFHIQVHIDHMDEEAAQAETGALKAPLIDAVRRTKIPNGYAQVTSYTTGTATAEDVYYSHARLDVIVMA